MDTDLLENPHDRFEEVGDGLRVLGAAFLVDNLPLSSDLVGDVLIEKLVGCVGRREEEQDEEAQLKGGEGSTGGIL